MTILEAMEDAQLFGRTFKRTGARGDTWKAWRAFVAALFGLPLDDDVPGIYQLHTGRSDLPAAPFREAFVVAGRRSGKSLVAALVAVFLAAFRDYGEVLAPGEIGTIMVIASDRRQARVVLGYINAFLEIPMLSRMVVSRLKESIELTNRVRIEVHTSSFRSVRGYTLLGCICDEIAFWPTEESASPDVEVLTALRPGMATVPGALLLCISSPYARRGALWEAYREHYGKAGAPVLVWQAETRAMNPTVSRLTIEAAYLRDPAAAAAEYGAQFRTDVEGFIPLEVVEAHVVPQRFELPPVSGQTCCGFVDPSGGGADSFTLAIAHYEGDHAVLDCLRERVPPFSPEDTVKEFVDVLRSYRLNEVTGDKYAGQWPREQFEKCGVSYRTSDKTRSELHLALLPALMSGQVELLDNKRLVAQLVGLERRTARAGRDSVDHAPGAHDDVANAAAGALVEALRSTGGVLGLVEYLKGVCAGTIADPDRPALRTTEQIQRDRDATLLFEAQLRGIKELRPTFTEPLVVACEKCGVCMAVRIGAARHCNSCGHDFYPEGRPEVSRVTRGDYLAGQYGRKWG